MKKVIIDTNLWISFLLGHQVQFVRRVLTDMRFEGKTTPPRQVKDNLVYAPQGAVNVRHVCVP